MTELRLVGDVIEMDRQVVATLVPGLRLGLRDRLVELFDAVDEDTDAIIELEDRIEELNTRLKETAP